MDVPFNDKLDLGQNLYQRVRWFNAARKAPDDGGPECDVCGNFRILAYVRDGYFTTRGCDCVALVHKAEALKNSGMYGFVLRCGFENFRTDAPWQTAMAQQVHRCLSTDKWLLLCGQSGSGKTHLAAAMCRELIAQGETVQFMSWPREIRRVCASQYDLERRETLLAPFRDAPVLFLDDLFKTRRNAQGLPEVSRQEQDVAFELIEHRYTKGLRTVITTEVLASPLRTLNEALFGRIKEKTGPFVVNIPYDRALDQRLQAS